MLQLQDPLDTTFARSLHMVFPLPYYVHTIPSVQPTSVSSHQSHPVRILVWSRQIQQRLATKCHRHPPPRRPSRILTPKSALS